MTETKTETKEGGRIYEVGYLITPDIEESKVGDEVQKIKNLLEKSGGVVVSEEFPKLKPLAYALTKRLGGKNVKVSNAYFGWVKFELESGNISKLKTELDAQVSIVRFILIKTVKENTIIVPRPPYRRPEAKKEPVVGQPVENPEHTTGMTEDELDKTIAELVVE